MYVPKIEARHQLIALSNALIRMKSQEAMIDRGNIIESKQEAIALQLQQHNRYREKHDTRFFEHYEKLRHLLKKQVSSKYLSRLGKFAAARSGSNGGAQCSNISR